MEILRCLCGVSVLLLLLVPSYSFPWPGTNSGSYYYKNENVDVIENIGIGITVSRWITSTRDVISDWSLSPPFMTKIEMPVTSVYPPLDIDLDSSYWLSSDVYYVVINGDIFFGNVLDEYAFTSGDMYWVMAGHRHGPIYCEAIESTDGKCTIMAMTSSSFQPKGVGDDSILDPSDDNPSVNKSLITDRTYRQHGDGKKWKEGDENPNNSCNGTKTKLMFFNSLENSPPLFRANWLSRCEVGYHYHPCGAMYFIAYGQMSYHGDVKDGMDDVVTVGGEVRWTGPGHPYGPEYNDGNEVMFSVLGFDPPHCGPVQSDPPPGPFKMQKQLSYTHIFDDEL